MRATGAVSRGGGGVAVQGTLVTDFLLTPDFLQRIQTLRLLRDDFGVRTAGSIAMTEAELSLEDLSEDSSESAHNKKDKVVSY